MKIAGRLVVIFPLLLAIVSFVLAMLCLFAGHKKGFMEDYAIVRVSTYIIYRNTHRSDGKVPNPTNTM